MDTETKLLIAAKALDQSIGGQAACLRAVELTLEALRGAAALWTGNAADHAEEIAAFDYEAWGLAAPQPAQGEKK